MNDIMNYMDDIRDDMNDSRDDIRISKVVLVGEAGDTTWMTWMIAWLPRQ